MQDLYNVLEFTRGSQFDTLITFQIIRTRLWHVLKGFALKKNETDTRNQLRVYQNKSYRILYPSRLIFFIICITKGFFSTDLNDLHVITAKARLKNGTCAFNDQS